MKELTYNERFLALATYLMSGDLKADFTMTIYNENPDTQEVENCGSVGCALGHTPYAIPELPKKIEELWPDYARRVFGINERVVGGIWDFCFGYDWAEADDTAYGAGQRILYMLRHGVPALYTERFVEGLEEYDYQSIISLYEKEKL